MKNTKSRILALYSSPRDLPRLRVDIEHKTVERILRELHVNPSIIQRLHAITNEDLTNALLEGNYEIIQFSGHGNKEGFLLEDVTLDGGGDFVSAKEIATLLHETSPQLKVAIFMSCYSADSISALVKAAPFILTVSGPADDKAAIDFIAQFYNAYLRYGVVERAFNIARNYIDSSKKYNGLTPLLFRRPMVNKENHVLYQANPSGKDDAIYIDLTKAERDIKSLKVTREEFLDILSRKIRVHKWIFDTPRQKVVLPLGKYFGLFSWNDANDVVICHRILKIKKGTNELACEVWASLIVLYNDFYASPYREKQKAHDLLLTSVLKEYQKTYRAYFTTGNKAKLLRKVVPEQFKLTKSAIISNLKLAEDKYHQNDYASMIRYLETALSAIHDLLNELTEVLTI